MGGSRHIRALRIARGSALDARSRGGNQLHGMRVTAPDELREEPRGLSLARLSLRASRFRVPTVVDTPLAATRLALRSLAQRFMQLSAEIARFDVQLARLVAAAAPQLVARPGIGNQIAGQLLVTAGANPTRLRSEGAFAMLVGAATHPSLVGQDRAPAPEPCRRPPGQLRALHACVEPHVPRPAHPGYVRRRTAEGKTKPEIIRCLKRYPGCRRSGSPVRRRVRSSARPRDGRGCVPGSRPPRSSRCRRLGSV